MQHNSNIATLDLKVRLELKISRLPIFSSVAPHSWKMRKKNYGMTIIAKNNESVEYPFISICGQHEYRRQKKRVVLLKNPGSTEFADGDTSNAIVTYNLWREHGLIETDPRKPRDFCLVNIGEEQLFQIQEEV